MRWWRIFKSRRKPDSEANETIVAESAQGHRRREAARFDLINPIKVRCASWAGSKELNTADVSATGFFVVTKADAAVGERVSMQVRMPDGTEHDLFGVVARIVKKGEGRYGAGLGIQLSAIQNPETQAAFEALIGGAQDQAPKPAEQSDGDPTDFLDIDLDDMEELDSDELLELEDLPEREPSKAEPLPTPAPPTPTPPHVAKPTAGVVIGIDLGTTNTSVGAVIDSKVVILQREDGRKSIPSVITFVDRGEVVLGDRERIATDPAHTIVSPKRILGRGFDEPEVERFTGQAPYRTTEGPGGAVLVEMFGDPYAVPQLVSYLLEDAKRVAEAQLGTTVQHAVVSVPISFEGERVDHLRRAGMLAGLEIVAVIDEPSAAALANRFDPGFGGVVGVYDFGGGTFDFSVVDVSHGDFRVLATSGDTWLGGDDFDEVLAVAAANQFWRKYQVDLRAQAMEWQRVLFACEKAKQSLTTREKTAISVKDVMRSADGMVDLSFTLDRMTFNRACSPIIAQSLDTCDQALELVGLAPTDLNAVYLSGGTTYIPAVREALAEHFKVPIRTGVPPEYAVCLGAAIHAAQMQLRSAQTLDSRDD